MSYDDKETRRLCELVPFNQRTTGKERYLIRRFWFIVGLFTPLMIAILFATIEVIQGYN